MHGKGTFYDPRLNDPVQYPVAVKAADQTSHLGRDLWPPDRSRLPTAESAESGSMPANQSGWFDDHQSAAPVEEASDLGKDEAIRSCCRPGSLVTFLEQCQLLTQEQILGGQRFAAAKKSCTKAERIRNDNLQGNNQLRHLPGHALHLAIVAQLCG
jgi:hypothetical protein